MGDAYMALEVCDTRDFDETLEGSGSGCCCSGDFTSGLFKFANYSSAERGSAGSSVIWTSLILHRQVAA